MLLLILDLLDRLVERLDHAVFLRADLRSGAAQVEPTSNVIHSPGNVVKRVVLQVLEVVLHQPRECDVRRGLASPLCNSSSMAFRPSSLFNKAR